MDKSQPSKHPFAPQKSNAPDRVTLSRRALGNSSVAVVALLLAISVTSCRLRSAANSAGNASSSSGGQDLITSLNAPTITTPSSFPYYTATNLYLSGTCFSGATVYVGDATETLSTNCVDDAFSIVISKAQDSTYDMIVYQVITSNGNQVVSQDTDISWIKDSTIPDPPVISVPATSGFYTNNGSQTISGTCEAGLTVELSGSSTQEQTCTGGGTFSFSVVEATSGVKSYNVIQTSLTQLSSTAASTGFVLDLAVSQTIALFHLNSSPSYTIDSSNFGAWYTQEITSDNNTASISGKFAEGRDFEESNDSFLSAPHSDAQDLLVNDYTIEAFYRLESYPNNNEYFPIVSKMGSSGQYSWEVGLQGDGGSSIRIYVRTSFNGTSYEEDLSFSINTDTSSFHHIAVTRSGNTVEFFHDGSSEDDDPIASSGAIFASDAPIVIGNGLGGNDFDGRIDEIRLSRNVRYSSNFTPPSSPFVAD